jgi:thioredoxin-like negative regulator of GroEL
VEKSVERTQRTFIKLSFGLLLGIILLIATIWGGHDVYVRWQERRLVRRALVDIAKGDDRDASVAARNILAIKPSSAPAARVMAQLAERAGERSALDWRRTVWQLDPHSVDDALALVQTGVQYNDIAIAERALAGIEDSARTDARFHAAAALIAQAKHESNAAETEWAAALHLAPNDKNYQLQLGTVLLRATDPQQRGQGGAMLTALRSDETQRSAATRALLTAAIIDRDDPAKLIALAKDLQSYPEATWTDHLMYLDLLHATEHQDFPSYLAELEEKAATDPGRTSALLSWMTRSKQNLLALDYLRTLPVEQLQKWPVPVAVADVYVELGKWTELEAMTRKAAWNRFEFLRHAYLSRALREQGKATAAEQEWNNAVSQAAGQTDFLTVLSKTVSEWKWEKEKTDLLWSLSKKPDKQRDAFLALFRDYTKAGDTEGLYRVLVHWAEIAPEDLNVQNNLAQISLLLDANVAEARRMAADVYRKAPTNPAYVTTYAYSLLTNGNPKEATKAMNSLTAEQLRDPAVSAYYGICLAALHDDKARDFLVAGERATLLPEEKKLVDKALANLNSGRQVH